MDMQYTGYIDISADVVKSKLEYRVILDATREQIEHHVEHCPMVYLAIFITTSVEDYPDYSWMVNRRGDNDGWTRVLMPMYIGGFDEEQQKIIVDQVIDEWFGDDFQEAFDLDTETTLQEDEIPGSY